MAREHVWWILFPAQHVEQSPSPRPGRHGAHAAGRGRGAGTRHGPARGRAAVASPLSPPPAASCPLTHRVPLSSVGEPAPDVRERNVSLCSASSSPARAPHVTAGARGSSSEPAPPASSGTVRAGGGRSPGHLRASPLWSFPGFQLRLWSLEPAGLWTGALARAPWDFSAPKPHEPIPYNKSLYIRVCTCL